jgi:acyl-coenzyme A synthetase/AMP-(fatty) acid ligase
MSLYQAFKGVAEQHPSHVAIQASGERFTYGEALSHIEEWSDFLGNDRQQAAGLIALEKTERIVWLQLALNKNKCIFATTDLTIPKERRRRFLDVLNPKWVFSQPGAEPLAFEGFRFIGEFKNVDVWERGVSTTYPTSVSHVCFSSGTSGQPKAIALKSKPLVSVVQQQADLLDCKKGSKYAWVLSPSFDASLSDVYVPLLSGATLHVCGFRQTEVKKLQSYFKAHEITHADLSPAMLPVLKNKLPETLRHVVFGGEVANESIVRDMAKTRAMYNAYGPTEATVCTHLKKVDESWTSRCLGVPLNGVHSKISEKGELWLSGEGLCVGYLDDNLNQEKFECDPKGVRWYKTGDRVEERAGEWYFLGRLDRQFKRHGVLVCPEEIERAAMGMGCESALCLSVPEFELIYTGAPTSEEIKLQLQNQLGGWMVPKRIRKVQEMTHNAHGKTQR